MKPLSGAWWGERSLLRVQILSQPMAAGLVDFVSMLQTRRACLMSVYHCNGMKQVMLAYGCPTTASAPTFSTVAIGTKRPRSVGLVGRSVDQSVGRSVRSACKPVGRSAGQPVGLSVGRSVGRSVCRSDNRSVGLSFGRSIGPSVCRCGGLSFGRPVGQAVHRSLGPPVHLTIGRSVGRSAGWSVCRPVGPSVDRSVVWTVGCSVARSPVAVSSGMATPQPRIWLSCA